MIDGDKRATEAAVQFISHIPSGIEATLMDGVLLRDLLTIRIGHWKRQQPALIPGQNVIEERLLVS